MVGFCGIRPAGWCDREGAGDQDVTEGMAPASCRVPSLGGASKAKGVDTNAHPSLTPTPDSRYRAVVTG